MSKPRLEIFQFEKQVCAAMAAYALSVGLNDPKKQQDNAGLKTPRVEFKYVWGGYSEHYWIRTAPQERWFDLGTGTLYAKVVTRRGDDKQDHYGMLGLIRSVMVDCTDPSALLDWHRFERMVEGATSPTTEDGQYYDVTSLSFNTALRIKFEERKSDIFLT